MKFSKSIFATALGLSTAVAALQFAPAEDETVRNPARHGVGALDHKTSGSVIRASQLMGANIQNNEGKSVGEINDIVLDARSGRVQYAAVSYGGFMGLGDKLFAVPFKAFQVKQNPNDPKDHDDLVLILNVTPEKLKGAQGFDKDHWPDFANQGWVQGIHKTYGLDLDVDENPNNGVDVNVNRNGIDVNVK